LRLWRVIWRLLAIALVVPGYYLWLRVSDAAIRAAGRLLGAEPSTGMRRTRALHRWARAVARLLGMRMESRGTPPAAPFFLVSNHVSYTDIVLIAAQLPCVFVAKAEVARWPVMGGICRIVDTVFIDRASKRDIPRVMDEIATVLGEGRGVVIFPEGTSTSGESVLRFRPSLLEIAARAGIPVSHACLYYETPPGYPPARDTVCWFGGAGFLSHILKVLQLPWIRARVTFGDAVVQGTDRKELASRLQAAVERNFEPMTRSTGTR
jgi:1-acyl-sn-glycerol-3-phosphate acyltransferase